MATRTTSKHFPSVIDRPAGRGSRNRTCEPAIKRRPPFIARCPTHRPAKPVRRKNPVKPGNTLRLSLSLSLFVPNNEHNGSISLGRLSFPQKRLHWMSGPKKKPIKARRLGHREGKLFSFNQPFPSRMPMFENLGQYCANSCLLIEISSIFELEYFIDMKSHVERLNQYVEPFKDCLSRSRLICRRLATWTFSLMNYSSTRAAILSISSLFCVSFPSPKTSFSISPGNGTPRTVVDVLFFLSFFFFAERYCSRSWCGFAAECRQSSVKMDARGRGKRTIEHTPVRRSMHQRSGHLRYRRLDRTSPHFAFFFIKDDQFYRVLPFFLFVFNESRSVFTEFVDPF